MKFIKMTMAILVFLLPLSLQAMDYSKPQMLKDKLYKEYWEQSMLFEDGTFVSSQFTAANFPWPVGKEHGLMVATVVSPDGKRTIIKNGRNLGEWGFDSEKFDLFIHTHRLKKEDGNFNFHIGTVGRNVVDAIGKMNIPPLNHGRIESKKGYMASEVYLPYFQGDGSWKIQPEKKQPFQEGASKVQGFGVHVLFTDKVENLLKSWLRIGGLQGPHTAHAIPFLSAIEKRDGTLDIALTLKNADGSITHFPQVNLDYKDIKKGNKKSSYPTVIEVTAENDDGKLAGVIRLTRKIDHFNINDHLNFLERSFTRSRASVTNFRYIAEYDLSYVTAAGTQKLTGSALSEYQDIQPPKKSRKKKKRR